MDLDDTATIRRGHYAAAENAGELDVSDFWDQYARAEVEYDARVQTYRPLAVGGAHAAPVDELLRELRMLLHATLAGRRRSASAWIESMDIATVRPAVRQRLRPTRRRGPRDPSPVGETRRRAYGPLVWALRITAMQSAIGSRTGTKPA